MFSSPNLSPTVPLPEDLAGKVFCSLPDLCRVTGMSRMTIIRLCARGIPYVQTQKKSRVRFPIQKALRWLIENHGHGEWSDTPKARRGRPRKSAEEVAHG